VNEAPFDIQSIYHDDKFTYIKTNAPEKFSVYELRDGKPNLITYDLREGTYVIPKIMSNGYVELGKKRMELINGVNFLGAASETGPFVLFSTSDSAAQGGEVSLPDLACDSLIASGLLPDAIYELSFTGPNVSSSPAAVLPGVLADMRRLRTNSQGVLRLEHSHLGNLGLRIARV